MFIENNLKRLNKESSYGLGQIEGLLHKFPEYIKLKPAFESISVDEEPLMDFLNICRICSNYGIYSLLFTYLVFFYLILVNLKV